MNLTPEATSEECVGDSCTLSSESDTDEGLKQTFAVQAPGVVTLTFFDDGKEVASQTVQLVDASRVTTSIEALMVAQNAEQELPLIAIGGRYQVLVDAYIKVDGKEEGLGIGGLIEMPTIEGEVSLSRTNWTQRLALNFEPTEAGESTVTLKLGGQDVRVNLKAIELDSITNLEVKHEAYGSTTRTDEDGDEIEVPLYQSNLSVLTAEESQVLGTVATWTAIDHPEFNSVTSSRLIYEYSESEMVAFEVKVGELVKEVLLPMNPNSSILYGEEIEGCNQANARTLPSLLLMMILVTHIVRRRWVV